MRISFLFLLLFISIDGFQRIGTLRYRIERFARGSFEDVERYRRIQQLAKVKELKELMRNGTFNEKPTRSTRRSFEQRLRTLVGIKADAVIRDSSNKNRQFGGEDEKELEQVMNDDSPDIDIPLDEEELLYERIVLEIMEEESTKEIEDNFALQREMLTSLSNYQNNTVPINDTGTTNLSNTSEDDMYTPRVSTWGIFPRPKNISQVYGGGRIINPNKLDEELQSSSTESEPSPIISPFQREALHRQEIETALKQARIHLLNGSSKQAIFSLEKIREYLIWETEFSGEAWIELAMAYETVYRLDEARSIYNKILQQNWSQKNRRNASLLLSGLDIAKKVSKKLAEGQQDTVQAFHSFATSDAFNEVMDKAVYSSWDSYKRRNSRYPSSDALLDKEIMNRLASYNYTSVSECYQAFMTELQPLSTVEIGILVKAVQRLTMTSVPEKIDFIASKDNRFRDEQQSISPLKSLIASLKTRDSLDPTTIHDSSNSHIAMRDFSFFVNGSWEIVTSFSTIPPFQRKRFEFAENRRALFLQDQRCRETYPSFFGLSTATVDYSCQFDAITSELLFTGDSLKRRSSSPWLQPGQSPQRVQVIYCDDVLMLTRQEGPSSEEAEQQQTKDLICLWKRLSNRLYRQYTSPS